MSRPAPIVLIAPAMAIGSRYYRSLVEEFEHRGWSARALGRRGFEPDEPVAGRGVDWSYDDEIEDIAVAVAKARADDPERPVLLLGHSLGGQLIAGHELTREPADAVVGVAAPYPYFRTYGLRGAGIVTMASVIVPVTTALAGYLPRPAFGAPGARTLMREWARMIRTGRPPFPARQRIRTPALLVNLAGDRLAPRRAVDAFAARFFDPATTVRRELSDATAGSLDHVRWVRESVIVVDAVTEWWASLR